MLASLLLLAVAVPPVDEASKDPSFLAFRTRLQEAIRAKDRAFVESLVTPRSKFSFGGDGGSQGFARVYPKGREPWSEWQRMLSLGGRFEKISSGLQFTAPYAFTDFPKDVDGIANGVSTVARLNVRAEPSTASYVIDHLDYEVFQWLDGETRKAWRRVRTPRGREGYVATSHTWSPVSYRAMFQKQGDAWKIIFLVQGD